MNKPCKECYFYEFTHGELTYCKKHEKNCMDVMEGCILRKNDFKTMDEAEGKCEEEK